MDAAILFSRKCASCTCNGKRHHKTSPNHKTASNTAPTDSLKEFNTCIPLAAFQTVTLLTGIWLYGVHWTCTETAAVSCDTSHVIKQRYNHFAGCIPKALFQRIKLQTLPVGTKPMASHHWSPGKKGCSKRKCQMIFLEMTSEGYCQSDEHWNHFKGNVGETSETGWSAYLLFQAHRYHLELNWNGRKTPNYLVLTYWTENYTHSELHAASVVRLLEHREQCYSCHCKLFWAILRWAAQQVFIIITTFNVFMVKNKTANWLKVIKLHTIVFMVETAHWLKPQITDLQYWTF